MDQKVVEEIAKGMYQARSVLDNWDKEQDHLKNSWREQAQFALGVISGLGYTLEKKEEAPAKKGKPSKDNEKEEVTE